MASVFKRGRWVDASGRKCSKETAGAKWRESRFWTIQYFLDGKAKCCRGYADKGASQQLAAKLEKAKAQGEQGMEDKFKPHRGRPLGEHVAEFVAELRTLGRDSMYVYTIEKRLRKLLDLCGWKVLRDITADSFCRWRETPIEQRQVEGEAKQIGPRTLNQYLESARGFCKWCVKRKRLLANPLAEVEKMDETADVRRARRAITADQVRALLAEVAPAHQMFYRFILSTGLRRKEARSLLWGDLRLDSSKPYVQLRAKATKARRADALPLRADVADELRAMRGESGDGVKVFTSTPTIERHRKYLAAAKIDWKDSEGRRADVHAMRHTYGTLLSKAGVSPREAMSLMRHTDMRLTMNVYTDPRILDLAGAVELLPLPSAGRSESVSGQSALIVECKATIGSKSGHFPTSVTIDCGSDWQQKNPSGMEGQKTGELGFEDRAKVLYLPGKMQESKPVAVIGPVVDSELQQIADAWPLLAKPLRAAVMALIRA